MNLAELRAVQRTERERDSLQELRPSFYRDVGEYVSDLEAKRDRLADEVEDPFADPEVSRLTDEVETATGVASAIYERRMGKLVKQASLAAAGMTADDDGLTAEERDLFDDLVERIGANQRRVLGVLDGEGADGRTATADDGTDGDERVDPEPPSEPPSERPPSTEAAESGGPHTTEDGDGTAESPVEGTPEDADGERTDGGPRRHDQGDVDRLTVRLTDDVGSILGVDDREYTLSSDDVVTLPAANATPLVENDAAEPLE